MAADRNYNSGDRTALIALSGGSCYYPDCGEPVVRKVTGGFEVALEIAHVCGLKPGSARHDPDMTDEERNSFFNIILLCVVHHKVVDRRDPASYPVELL